MPVKAELTTLMYPPTVPTAAHEYTPENAMFTVDCCWLVAVVAPEGAADLDAAVRPL